MSHICRKDLERCRLPETAQHQGRADSPSRDKDPSEARA